jgi:DNA-binding transcriptional LysR family regulator
MERYGRAFPNVRVRVYEDSGHFIEHKLINGELDAALLILSTLEDPQSFRTSVLVSSPWRLWVSSRHRLSESDSASINDLRREFVIELRDDELERAAGNLWRRAGFMPQVVVRTRSVEATRNFVAAGSGVSLMPQLLFRPWSLDGEQLIALPLSEDLPLLQVGVAWRRGAPVSPETEAFLAVAREHGQEAARRSS